MSLKVLTCNVNGIRSATQKAFWPWIMEAKPDIICLQEIRAREEQFPPEALRIEGYHTFIQPALRPGYSGVAIYSRAKPLTITSSVGHELIDDEGRYLQIDFKDLSVLSVYFPSGSSGPDRQAQKYIFLEAFIEKLKQFRESGRSYIVCGDWNIAHKEIDIKNWKANQKNSGFLPEERAWMDQVLDQLGYVDAFRVSNNEAEQYTWWSNRGAARAKNVGWRIDYQVVTPCLRDKVRSVEIYKERFFSDHAPLIVDYDINIGASAN